LDDAANDEDDYIPTKTQATQTGNPTMTPIIASVVTRAQAKQQQQQNHSCEEHQSKRNIDLLIDRYCVLEPKQNRTDVVENQIIPFTYEQLKELQHQDEQTKHMMTRIEDFNEFFIQDDMLMTKSFPQVPFVPRGRIRSDIIKIYHDTPANGAHFG
jgi:hypothetical protein